MRYVVTPPKDCFNSLKSEIGVKIDSYTLNSRQNTSFLIKVIVT